MVRLTLLSIGLSVLSIFCRNQKTEQSIQSVGQFREDWESLAKFNEEPEWFKDAKFDPQQWADLFVRAGARFAGPVAEHHDGFSMWDSETTPWNRMDKGPCRDITGELERTILPKKCG